MRQESATLTLLQIFCCTLTLMFAAHLGVAWAQQEEAPPATTAEEQVPVGRQVQQAITQLTREANQLENVGDIEFPAVIRRTHPVVQGISSEQAPLVLRRMLQPFTGNQYRDTYIRWHLMPILQGASPEVKNNMARDLERLTRNMPPAINFPYMQERQYVPLEIYQQWRRLWAQTYVQEGYPPFIRRYWGRAAMERVTGAERARIAALVEQMDILRPQWEEIIDRDAIAFNNRLDDLNYIMRQYRGEVIYELLATGDSRVLDLVISTIANQARAGQNAAFDILAFVYMAYLDGLLERYDEASLTRISQELLSVGRQLDVFREYLDGERRLNHGRGLRNFADYVSHLVYVLRLRDDLPWPRHIPSSEAVPVGSRTAEAVRTQTELNRIQEAIERGMTALYLMEPEWTFERYGRRGGVPPRRLHAMGHFSAVAWALLQSGEPVENPRLFRLVSWILSQDRPFTYDRGLRANVLAQLPPAFWQSWVRRDFLWLSNAMTNQGSFNRQWEGQNPPGYGDNTHAFYGLLGLWATARAGQVAPYEKWAMMNQYWREGQLESGAWGRVSAKAPEGQKSPNPVMTAAGVTALTITRLYMDQLRPPRNVTSVDAVPELEKGLAWLNSNFSINDPRTEDDWFFYMWIIQQVGNSSGYRLLNNIDWHQAVTEEILGRQRTNGQWNSPQGVEVSSAFAMLYLSQANSAIGITKLQHSGNWNNWPSDLLNLSRYISDRFETPITWQIVTPTMPVPSLLESPILYISADAPLALTPEELENIRMYIRGGGLVVLNLEENNAQVQRSLREFVDATCGAGAEIKQIPNNHDLLNVNVNVRANFLAQVVENQVRPLMIILPQNASLPLHTNRTGEEVFKLLTNAYVYATGKQPRVGRLERAQVDPTASDVSGGRVVHAARVMYSDQADPEPGALANLGSQLSRRHQMQLDVENLRPEQLTSRQQIAFLAVTPSSSLTDAQASAIGQWLEQGGTLWMDAVGGTVAGGQKMYELANQIAPQRGNDPVAQTSSILTGRAGSYRGNSAARAYYRRYTLFGGLTRTTPRLQVVRINDRPAIYLSGEDLTAGIAGLNHWGIHGYTPDTAMDIVINGVLDVASR